MHIPAVANAQLRGGCCDISAALVQQYVNFADNEILPAACTWAFPTLGIMQYNKQVGSQCKGHSAKEGQGCDFFIFFIFLVPRQQKLHRQESRVVYQC